MASTDMEFRPWSSRWACWFAFPCLFCYWSHPDLRRRYVIYLWLFFCAGDDDCEISIWLLIDPDLLYISCLRFWLSVWSEGTMGKSYPTVSEEYKKAIDKCKKKLRGFMAEKGCAPLMLRIAWVLSLTLYVRKVFTDDIRSVLRVFMQTM